MSSRDRTCRHLLPNVTVNMPNSTHLAELAPAMRVLIDVAAEYEACADPEQPVPFSAVDWVRWLDVEVRRSVEFGSGVGR